MPDVWTTNPEKLKGYLIESGSICGIPGRVLQDRDPHWTCTYDSKGWLRDIYIHPIEEVYFSSPFLNLLILSLGLGILVGLLWGRRFWRRAPSLT
jgi:hypothetical protein